MELTLAVPCQALLILDANFPVDLLSQVVQALSVTPAPDADAKHARIDRLEHIKTLHDLYSELDKREFLRGRYIIFPHVGKVAHPHYFEAASVHTIRACRVSGDSWTVLLHNTGKVTRTSWMEKTGITATSRSPYSKPPIIGIGISPCWGRMSRG